MAVHQSKIHNNRGSALLMRGMLDAARQELEIAIQEDPSNVAALTNFGYLLSREGRIDEAILLYQRAIGMSPGYAVAHNNLGLAYTEKEQHAEALEAYKTAIFVDPAYAVAHLNIAQLHHVAGDLSAAADAYGTYLRLRPGDVHALYNLGVVRLEQGLSEQAASCFWQAVRVDRDHAEARINLAAILARKHQWDQAIDMVSPVIARNPDHQLALYHRALAFLGKGDLESSAADLGRDPRARCGRCRSGQQPGAHLPATGQATGSSRPALVVSPQERRQYDAALQPGARPARPGMSGRSVLAFRAGGRARIRRERAEGTSADCLAGMPGASEFLSCNTRLPSPPSLWGDGIFVYRRIGPRRGSVSSFQQSPHENRDWTKPTCTTCRQVYSALRESGVNFDAVDYYLDPISRAKLLELLHKMRIKPRDLLRTKEAIYKTLKLAERELSDDEIVDLMVEHPDLIQRPIVEKGARAILARPPERLKEIL